MRKFGAGLVLLGLVALAGCPQKNTGTGTGPRKGAKVTLEVPAEPVTALPGGKKEVEVTVNRPTDFQKDVTLSAEVSAVGKADKSKVEVSIEPKVLKPDKAGKATLTFRAEETAAGEFKVTVTATPAEGEPARAEVRFKVPAA
jgi:hypothetical protein